MPADDTPKTSNRHRPTLTQALVAEVGRFAEVASGLLACTYRPSLAPKLMAAVASARQLAGWTAFDSGLHLDAQRHWLAAERVAVGAGDLRLAARIRYCQARQFQHLQHNHDALDTLTLAHQQSGTTATAAINAMLHGARAASLAAVGREPEALTALGAASEAFDQIVPDQEPEWMAFFDQGEVLAQYGRVHRDLARADRTRGPEAVRWVSQAIDAFGSQNVRSTILNEVGLCSALFLADQPEQALAAGARVLAHANELTSRRVFDRIGTLRRDLAHHRARSDVADFEHLLTSARAAHR